MAPEPARPAAPPPGSSPPGVRPRLRLTCIAGTIGAAALVAAFFLPWVEVPPETAADFRRRIDARLADPVQPLPEGVDRADWARLARIVDEEGHVTGLDVFYWARTATRTAGALKEEPGGAGPVGRSLRVLAVGLAALPVAATGLALAFVLLCRLRRAGSLLLVLALLTGAGAIACPAAYSIARPALAVETRMGDGLRVLLAAGALLVLVGTFGVRARNWWRVLLGALLAAAAIAGVAWRYVTAGGGLP